MSVPRLPEIWQLGRVPRLTNEYRSGDILRESLAVTVSPAFLKAKHGQWLAHLVTNDVKGHVSIETQPHKTKEEAILAVERLAVAAGVVRKPLERKLTWCSKKFLKIGWLVECGCAVKTHTEFVVYGLAGDMFECPTCGAFWRLDHAGEDEWVFVWCGKK